MVRVSGSSMNSSGSSSNPCSSARSAAAAAAADGLSGVGICSGSGTVSFEARRVLLEDDVGEGDSGGFVTGDCPPRPSVDGDGDGTNDPGLIATSDSYRALFKALWRLRYDSRTAAHHVAIDMPVGLRGRTSSSSALARIWHGASKPTSPPGSLSSDVSVPSALQIFVFLRHLVRK